MLIDVPSVTEEGIQNKRELKERCNFIKILEDANLRETAIYLFQEKQTGIYFTLPVIKGDDSAMTDDEYRFPYSAEYIQNHVVQRKEREVTSIEVYYE